MPWKVSDTVSERKSLLVRLENGERMSELCREYGITPKTVYKFLNRYEKYGDKGLEDESRAPLTQASKTSEFLEAKILGLKDRYPTWGARKLYEILSTAGELNVPAVGTIHRILAKHGKVIHKKRRPINPAFRSSKIHETKQANELWCMDFKGQFKTQNGQLCYPLTVSDHFSRFLLTCEGLENTTSLPVECALEMAFHEYGLPLGILSDNGCPFGAPKGLFGLSRISVWLMRLGIKVFRIEPGHPEQNGRHERMHLTLKRSTTRPAAQNLLQQQERFDNFQGEYNNERPHEALAMKTPASAWQRSDRIMPSNLPDPDYKMKDLERKVYDGGGVVLRNRRQFTLGAAFVGQPIGLTEEEDGIWKVSFMQYDLGYVDEKTYKFEPMEELTLSPM
jgi:transposase InsO family protein